MDRASSGILRLSAFSVFLAVGAWAAPPQVAVAIEFTVRTVAVMGEQMPGLDPGVTLGFVGGGVSTSASINALGQVAFRGTVAGPTVDGWTDIAAFAEGPGGLALVLWEGTQAAGVEPGVIFHCPSGRVQYNDLGQALIFSRLTGAGIQGGGLDNNGVWLGPPGGLALLVRSGQPAPGTPAGVNFFNEFQASLLNNAGQVMFLGFQSDPAGGPGHDRGIWLGAPGDLQLVARVGGPAPDTEPDTLFSNFFSGSFRLNNAGEALFTGQLSGPGIDGTNNLGIWGGTPGNVRLRVRSGMPAPGTEPGVNFRGSSLIGFNDAGQTSFRGLLTGPGVDVTNNTGIWSDASGTLALLAREGAQAPGTEPGVVFSHCFNNVALSGSGRVALSSRLDGPGTNSANNQGLWAGDAAGLSLRARIGSHAPGMPAGVVFSLGFGAHINALGDLAFVSLVAGPGVNATNNVGLWSEVGGALRLIIRSGETLEVRPGDTRIVSDLLTNTRNIFNQAGQLAFAAEFTDGSQGVFAATPVPPSCALPGDLTQDGVVDGRDVDGFLRAKLGLPAAAGENEDCAEFGAGGLSEDTAAFIGALLAGS